MASPSMPISYFPHPELARAARLSKDAWMQQIFPVRALALPGLKQSLTPARHNAALGELIQLAQHGVAHHRGRDAGGPGLQDVAGAHAALQGVLHGALDQARF